MPRAQRPAQLLPMPSLSHGESLDFQKEGGQLHEVLGN